METPDIFEQPPAPQRPARQTEALVTALEQECLDLRMLFHATIVALVFLALGVNLFFFKQMRLVQQQVNDQRPAVLRLETEFRQNRHPEISQFMAQLQAYAASHRDFQTNILDRYRPLLPQYFNAALPVQSISPLTPATNPPGR